MQSSYIFFYSSSDQQTGYLSNWYPSCFTGTRGGQSYISVEQYMMQKKAIVMSDTEIEQKIMSFTSDGFINSSGQINWNLIHNKMKEIRSLGRKVKNFDGELWDKYKYKVMKQGLVYKFSQNQYLLQMLLSTGNSVLVEASPHDKIWGIGYSVRDAPSSDPNTWGQNLLGKALVEIRDMLRHGVPEWAVNVDIQPIKFLEENKDENKDGVLENAVENEIDEEIEDEDTVEDVTLNPENEETSDKKQEAEMVEESDKKEEMLEKDKPNEEMNSQSAEPKDLNSTLSVLDSN